ncbi:hypothetical protein OESDEN_02428 [Oesophagostomum dentatum]|uniref:Uncharacterized protein n=1 Tax=Oesophagostomum dentatum TaxID=61180 RepID=A0A0B1TK30_OESDE|nr:hypothetical protein OESDEN_02428 [Oesophagostomum dentatum]
MRHEAQINLGIIVYFRYRAMDYPLNWTENRIADPSSYAVDELDVCPDTDYIIQLMGEAEHKKYYSKQKFYHTAQLSSRAGALTFTKSWPLKVDFIPPAKLAVKDLKFKINVRKGNPKANATVIMNKTFPTMIDGLESGGEYIGAQCCVRSFCK